MEKITVKISSFSHGSLSHQMNAQTELMNTKPSEIEQIEWDEIAANFPEYAQTKTQWSYEDLKSRLKEEGCNGRKEKMFPQSIFGLSELTIKEIQEFTKYNLIILGLRNKIY